MRLMKRVFWGAVIVLAAVFAFINLHIVDVNLDPLGTGLESLEQARLPLAFIILGSVALGLVLGVVLSYDATRPARRELRAQKRQAQDLKRENDRMTEALKSADHPDTAGPPVLRSR